MLICYFLVRWKLHSEYGCTSWLGALHSKSAEHVEAVGSTDFDVWLGFSRGKVIALLSLLSLSQIAQSIECKENILGLQWHPLASSCGLKRDNWWGFIGHRYWAVELQKLIPSNLTSPQRAAFSSDVLPALGKRGCGQKVQFDRRVETSRCDKPIRRSIKQRTSILLRIELTIILQRRFERLE